MFQFRLSAFLASQIQPNQKPLGYSLAKYQRCVFLTRAIVTKLKFHWLSDPYLLQANNSGAKKIVITQYKSVHKMDLLQPVQFHATAQSAKKLFD